MTRQRTDPQRVTASGPGRPSKNAALGVNRRTRLVLFAGLALVVGTLAIGLVISRVAGPAKSDANAVGVRVSMEGFNPAQLTVAAGSVVNIDLIDPDSSMHSDGGGVHSFHIDALNVHEKVQPLTDLVFSFQAPTAPGTYGYYCDTCCGGKENPSMNGTLTVTA